MLNRSYWLSTENWSTSSITTSSEFRVWFLLTPCPSSTWREVPLRRSFLTCAGTPPGWAGSSHRPCTVVSSTAAPTVESSSMMSFAWASRSQVMSAWCQRGTICQRIPVRLNSGQKGFPNPAFWQTEVKPGLNLYLSTGGYGSGAGPL